MQRDKKLVLLSHCLLNVNAKVYGLANYRGAQEELIKFLLEEGFGLMQLPCPELGFAGLKRWGQVKEQLDTPYFVKHCHRIFAPFLEQILDYRNNGYKLSAIIGVNGSPSCGVNVTCSSNSWGGEIADWQNPGSISGKVKMIGSSGVFMEQIKDLLASNEIIIPMLSVEEANPTASIADIKKFLKGEF